MGRKTKEQDEADYPSDDAPEVYDLAVLPEEADGLSIPGAAHEALDEHFARQRYAFATRQEKYELYRRFKGIRGRICLTPRHKDNN